MTSEWKQCRIGDLGKVITGRTPPGTDEKYFGGDIHFLTPSDFDGSRIVNRTARTLSPLGVEVLKRVLVERGVAVSCIGWQMGKAVLINHLTATNQQINTIVPNESKVSLLFLYYSLAAHRKQIFGLGSTATRTPIVNKSTFENITIPIPSLAEQHSIANILGSLDDKIELNLKINATLEQIAQALFKSWFIDFDPVKAKAEGREPEGMDNETAALFPDEFEKSELGLIPKGWAVKNVGSLLQLTTGGDWGSETQDDKHQMKVSVIRGTDIPTLRDGGIEKIPRRYIQSSKFSKRQLQDGDIIIEISGGSRDQATGRSLYITGPLIAQFDEPVIPASFCRLFRGINKELSLLLALHLRCLYDRGGTWEYQNQSTGISNFQTGHFLENEMVIVPDEKVLVNFFKTVRSIIEKQYSNENVALTKIRDSLLPKLISGQFPIPDIEQIEGGTQ